MYTYVRAPITYTGKLSALTTSTENTRMNHQVICDSVYVLKSLEDQSGHHYSADKLCRLTILDNVAWASREREGPYRWVDLSTHSTSTLNVYALTSILE